MKMSITTAKYEALIKQYLRSILDINAHPKQAFRGVPSLGDTLEALVEDTKLCRQMFNPVTFDVHHPRVW